MERRRVLVHWGWRVESSARISMAASWLSNRRIANRLFQKYGTTSVACQPHLQFLCGFLFSGWESP
jgi:hypothetical protein